jgi:hypothetical protein
MSLKKYTLSEEVRHETGQDIVGVFTGAPDVICGALEDLSVGHCLHHCSLRENGSRRTELEKLVPS